MVCLRE
jgi:hypothetical protein